MSWKFRVKGAPGYTGLLVALAVVCFLNGEALGETPPKVPQLRITKPPVRPTGPFTPRVNTTPSPPSSTTDSHDETNATSTLYPPICTHGLKISITTSEEETVERRESDFVETIEGEVVLSVFTSDPTSALFVINRLNVGNFLQADFEIGVRAIYVDNESLAETLLLQEVSYLQQCLSRSIGIFMDWDLYQSLEEIIKDLEYNIWSIPSIRMDLFPKAAHLLHQMPWGDKIASVEIMSENLNVFNDFMEATRHEHMCLMHFKSEDNIYIVIGNKMATNFKENGTIFAIPTERTNRAIINELPDKSFILMESEVDIAALNDKNLVTLDEPLVGKTVLPSRVLAFAKPVLSLMKWLKASLAKNCKRVDELIAFETCKEFLSFVGDFQNADSSENSELNGNGNEVADILDLLHIRKLATAMNFQMFQKKVIAADIITGEPKIELNEIASQNFLTNVTTFYHYNRDNHTSLELKTKFGQVFNCQYSPGENSRYPFLFDGESVMFWRIKTEAWVATGMTAAILGVIFTLAILVFIVVRISLGDVFEGNPVTSILLLLSLVLVFSSFIPFSMEYVGEQRNSHITFEDAQTLNTLCAVRVFILTLVYCFVFAILLCRAVMLASIGTEGGFLSHVNGYIQAVICVFSIFVQIGMSIQLLVGMHIASDTISCESMYYGNWLWSLIAYDFILLISIVSLIPFIYRSQRNYREGILLVIGSVLMLIIWIVWITMSFFGDDIRDAAIPLGLQATGWAILVGILIPRTFLIVRGIERSDIAQALPSLTSLAFAQNNQYASDQSVYECVNPAMRNCSMEEMHQSPSEIPTLPLRGGGPRRQQFFANLRQANANINPSRPPPRLQRASPSRSSVSSLPPSPDHNKITRF